MSNRKINWFNELLNIINIQDIISINNKTLDQISINNKTLDQINIDDIKREDQVEYICQNINCDNINKKSIRNIKIYTNTCKKCTQIHALEEFKKTNLENLGVEFPAQSMEVEQKKQNTIKKLNEEDPDRPNRIIQTFKNTIEENNKKDTNRLIDINNKKIETFINNYGVKNPQQNKEIRQKTKNTIKQYKIDNPLYYDNIVEKRQHTMENEYGVKHALQVIKFYNKSRDTLFNNYGVDNPMHNEEIFIKSQKKSYLKKDYKLPSGTIIQVQGYEQIALDELFENNYKEDDIITQYQVIEYEFENNTHKYYADIYIKSENKIIEVKSDYTMDLHYDKNMAKWEACVDSGYEFEFWIYDKKKKNKEVLKL